MKRLAVFSLAVVLASSTAAISLAQPGAGRGAMREACGADMAQLCPDAQPGPGRRQCMMAHTDQLSDACKSAVAAAMAARRHAGRDAAPPSN